MLQSIVSPDIILPPKMAKFAQVDKLGAYFQLKTNFNVIMTSQSLLHRVVITRAKF